MARRYPHASAVAAELDARRRERALGFEALGILSGVDGSQAFRICRGEFKTLNPSVLKICNALGVRPHSDCYALPLAGEDGQASMLSAEVLATWDRTESGAKRLQRILRALRE